LPSATADPRLERIEAYYDAVPRSAARAEHVGPFTLFVRSAPGWPYYARPSLGATSFTPDDVQRVRHRQRELSIPETFEWVDDVTPTLADALAASGLPITRHPLMLLEHLREVPVPDGVNVRLAREDDDLALFNAIAHLGFGHPGTARGEAGIEDAYRAVQREDAALAGQRQRLREGRTITAIAEAGDSPVASGSHQPVGDVSELVGIAVLPAFRRRGIAAALTHRLVQDALERNVRTVFLSAGDADVARVYARVGFRTIATACAAEPG
jgi:N-acetylglutamate synthase-like GNAT family acetyltransferase